MADDVKSVYSEPGRTFNCFIELNDGHSGFLCDRSGRLYIIDRKSLALTTEPLRGYRDCQVAVVDDKLIVYMPRRNIVQLIEVNHGQPMKKLSGLLLDKSKKFSLLPGEHRVWLLADGAACQIDYEAADDALFEDCEEVDPALMTSRISLQKLDVEDK